MNIIVTAGRAGSSFLASQLNLHPSVACLNETHYLPLLLDAFGDGSAKPADFLQIIADTNFHNGSNILESNFPFLGISSADWTEWQSRLKANNKALTVAGFQSLLEQFICEKTGADVVVDKTPCYGAHLEALEEQLGDIRVIILSRDALPSIKSMLKHPGFLLKVRKGVNTWTDVIRHHEVKEEDMSTTLRPGEEEAMAKLWAWRTTEPIRQAKQANIRYRNLFYEDMQKAPKEFFEVVESFFELERSSGWVSRSAEQVKPSNHPKTALPQEAHSISNLISVQSAIRKMFGKRRASDKDSLGHVLTIPEVIEARSLLGYPR